MSFLGSHRDFILVLVAIAGSWAIDVFVTESIDPVFLAILMYAGINIILAVSLNVITGFTGQFSIGHAGFMAVGAYSAALAMSYFETTWPSLTETPVASGFLFAIALLVGGGASGIVGYVVGLPSLRLKGDYLAIVTLGFGEIIRVLLLNMEVVGGARGMPGISARTSFGWIYSLVAITLLATTRLIHSPTGRELLAVREDEIAAEAMGVNTTSAKVRAFVFGAFFGGIAGGLFAHYLRYLNPSIFDFQRSFEVMTMVVLGGMGSISGSVVAAVLLTGLKEYLHKIKELGITTVDIRMIVYSLCLIVLMLTRPNGLFGRSEITDWFKKSSKLQRRRAQPAEVSQ